MIEATTILFGYLLLVIFVVAIVVKISENRVLQNLVRGERIVCERHYKKLRKGQMAIVSNKQNCTYCKKHIDETNKIG